MIANGKYLAGSVSSNKTIAFHTKLGWMAAEMSEDKLLRLTFGHASATAALMAIGSTDSTREMSTSQQKTVDRLTAFAAGHKDELAKIPVEYGKTTLFQKRVLDACRAIPAGETLSYAQLAVIAGAPGAARAVGNVMRTNKIPLVIPCHRVVGSGGALGGYSAPDGLAMKRRLLEREGAAVRG